MIKIKFENFSCYYKNRKETITALNSVNLEIESGELLALVGESGSGKSTMLKSILGKCDYVDGNLTVNNVPIDNLDLKNTSFAFVKQEIALYPHLTVFDNIAFPLKSIHTGREEIEKRVKTIAKRFDIDWLLTRKPKQLSIGQQQRVAIARALVKNPEIVMFDEPFANVDPVLKAELRQLVKRLHKEFNMTIVFATHDLDEAFALADRIAVLEKGRLVDIATPESLRQGCNSSLIKTYLSESIG